MERVEWQKLAFHQNDIADQHMRDWFARDNQRFSRFTLSASGIFLDYSRNRITEQTIELLCDLAKATDLTQKIDALFNGEFINRTEMRPALHTALRDKNHTPISNEANLTGANFTTIESPIGDKHNSPNV